MQSTNLKPLAERIVAALKTQPTTWFTRRDIARALGKRQLSPYHLTLLEKLKNKGLIEVSHRPNETPIGYEWLYRVSSKARR